MNKAVLEEIKQLKHDPLPKRSEQEIKELVDSLLSKMTLEEKIGQLYQSAPPNAQVEGMEYKEGQDTITYIKQGKCGSILSITNPVDAYNLQKTAVEQSRLKIPLFFGMDVVHGCRTIFPINLAMSCSFDTNLIEKCSQIAASEASHMGIHLTFSPMVDLVRDPRWGRVMESNGEDPYVNSVLAEAYISGYQQNGLESYHSLGACVKHFAGYGASEAGREYNTVDMSDRHLRMYHLPGYYAAVTKNAAAMMTSFNIIDGVPATCNSYLLRTILRDEWKYQGFVISDYTSSIEIINHKVARNKKEVAYRCLLAGLDVEMVSMSYVKYLKTLVEEKKVEEKLIDEACQRILTFKYQLGLFDNPYKSIYADANSYCLLPSYRQTALEIAKKSVVLLKNNNQVLPLQTNKKVALIGPYVKERNVMGAWNGIGKSEECTTLEEGMLLRKVSFKTAAGSHLLKEDATLLNEAIEVASLSDIIICAIGEPQSMCGESASRAGLTIPLAQQRLVASLKSLNKPIIVIIFSGRPLDLSWYENNIDGILQAWFLGNESGNALADIICGHYNPSGKLTMSFPYTVGQIPVYYNQYQTGRPSLTGGPNDTFKSSYIDIPNTPLYPFGYGLSYTNFEFSDFKISTHRLIGNQTLKIYVNVKNIGAYAGEQTVQLYIACLFFSVTRPVKELKGFKKVFLEPNEIQTCMFTLTADDLAYLNIENKMTPENTTYKIFIGEDSTTTLYKTIEYMMEE